MKLKILPELPSSQKWVTTKISSKLVRGIVWENKDVLIDDQLFLYTNWASVHFESDWYELMAKSTTKHSMTVRDIGLLKTFLGDAFDNKGVIIDVNSGSGRHSFELAKLGFTVIGMEGANLLRSTAKKIAEKKGFFCTFVPTTISSQLIYSKKADIVISMFNSMGYTFNYDDDKSRLEWMARLLKPGGYFILDIRAENFQKEHYSKQPVKSVEVFKMKNEKGKRIEVLMSTQKYWNNKILGAKENVILKSDNAYCIAQNTTYGWKTYSISEISNMLKSVGISVISTYEDYYSNAVNTGERIFFIGRSDK